MPRGAPKDAGLCACGAPLPLYRTKPCLRCAPCERIRARHAKQAWKARNPLYRHREDQKEKARARALKWHRENPERARFLAKASAANYKARQEGAPGHVTRRELRELFEEYRGLCAYCPRPAGTVDHVIPLTRGGTNEIRNLVPACGGCNSSKRNTPLLVWLARGGYRGLAA